VAGLYLGKTYDIVIMKGSTEQNSNHQNLENKSVVELLQGINSEDKSVPLAIQKSLPQIKTLTEKVVSVLENGGRIFYIGAGTSGRLGIVDASELPPTYGVEQGLVIGLIAGGDTAIRKAVEFAEDDPEACINDLKGFSVASKDMVIGIAASGRTPYVTGGLAWCQKNNIATGCIVCNENSAVAAVSDFPVEVITGPEFVTGSTRMKAGTAQKLVLNMISTTAMIKTGHVIGNRMVDMQLTNHKLVDRGTRMVMEQTGKSYDESKSLLLEHKSVRKAVEVSQKLE
jgi:N-acetylmuramic acid 6-phosphate etherase